MKKIVLLDGHSVLNRAFYGIMNLNTTDGFPTNAIYGFLSIMFKVIEDEKPDCLAVAFDVHAPTFRHKMYDNYKGTRKKPDDNFLLQVPKMKEVLASMGIPFYEMAGYEADDIIGTLAKRCQADGNSVSIVSGDRDLLQLVDEHIIVKLAKPQRGNSSYEDYDINAVLEKYSLLPKQIIELKALMGDSSDNIPGLPGVGEKTATNILKEFSNIENAFDNIDKIYPPKAKRAFEEHFDMALLSKKLATICLDAPVEPDYDKMAVRDYFNDDSYKLFKELELKRFLSKFDLSKSDAEFDIRYENISSNKLREVLKDCDTNTCLGVAVVDSNVSKMSVALADKLYVIGDSNRELLEYIYSSFKRINSFDSAFIIEALRLRVSTSKIFDNQIAAYLLNPTKKTYFYDDIARDYLGINIKSKSELFDKKNAASDALDLCLALSSYAACKSSVILETELKKSNMLKLFEKIEMPLCYSLTNMKLDGILIKEKELEAYSLRLEKSLEELSKKIYEEAGEEFNINSPKQLGTILFDKLKLPSSKKTKSGYSTSVDVLEKLKNDYPIVADVLEYRQFSKFKSTYTDALPNYVADDGRIHSDFLQTVTATGRISSANPNLQNIPVRTELGRSIRKVFVPREDCIFIDADYSQIELRILAHLSQDENLINDFNAGHDIHQATASKVFNVPIDEVTKELRSSAKAVNFGIVYGISAFGLSQDLNIPVKEAKQYIEQYFETYPKVKAYLDALVKNTKESGYSYTALNRRRPVPEINASNAIQRGFGERIAMNSPVQGTAADIMKIAMNSVCEELYKRGLKSKLVLQVHDELLIEAYNDEADIVENILKEKMEDAYELSVPLLVEVARGDSWYETK